MEYKEFFSAMKSLGASDAQIGSKAVTMALSVLGTNDPVSAFSVYHGMINAMDQERDRYVKASEKLSQRLIDVEQQKVNLEKDEKRIANEVQKLEALKEEIFQMETPTMRDRLKAAKWYSDNIVCQNVYQETERIKGLSKILSGDLSEGNPIPELSEQKKAGRRL